MSFCFRWCLRFFLSVYSCWCLVNGCAFDASKIWGLLKSSERHMTRLEAVPHALHVPQLESVIVQCGWGIWVQIIVFPTFPASWRLKGFLERKGSLVRLNSLKLLGLGEHEGFRSLKGSPTLVVSEVHLKPKLLHVRLVTSDPPLDQMIKLQSISKSWNSLPCLCLRHN